MTTPSTTPCTRCGAPVAADELRCPTCDTLAPVPDDDAAPIGGTDETRADAPPWAIPIREPAVTARVAVAPTILERMRAAQRDTVRLVALAVLALVVFTGTVVAGAQLLTDGDDARTSADGPGRPDEAAGLDPRSVQADTGTAQDTDGDADDEPAPTSSAPTTSATAPTTSTTSTTAPTTTTAGVPGTGSVPELSASFRRGWVAQLTSVPYSAGTARLEAAWDSARATAPGAVATRSDHGSSLRDGYWVIVDPGPFDSADDVRAFCAAAGYDAGDDCLPRELDGRR